MRDSSTANYLNTKMDTIKSGQSLYAFGILVLTFWAILICRLLQDVFFGNRHKNTNSTVKSNETVSPISTTKDGITFDDNGNIRENLKRKSEVVRRHFRRPLFREMAILNEAK